MTAAGIKSGFTRPYGTRRRRIGVRPAVQVRVLLVPGGRTAPVSDPNVPVFVLIDRVCGPTVLVSVLIALVYVLTAPACGLIVQVIVPVRGQIVRLFALIAPLYARIVLVRGRIVRPRVRNVLWHNGPVLELAAPPIPSARRRGRSDLRLVHKQGRNNNSEHGRNKVRVRSSGPGPRVAVADNAGIAHRAPGRIDDDNFLRCVKNISGCYTAARDQ